MRIATFNCENLFARYKFKEEPTPSRLDGFLLNDLAFDLLADEEKQLTAAAIREIDADVVCLQEVESLPVLDHFSKRYLKNMGYERSILIDGNDQRGIDVALLSRHPIVSIATHRHEQSTSGSRLFSRDCLEARIDVGGKTLTVYVNHFKSMVGGRPETAPRRREQANRVAAIVDEQWGARGHEGNFVVLGDLNDYPGGGTALGALLEHPHLENVVDRLPEDERWTHYYAGANEYHQLDYLLLSKSLAAANAGVLPTIMRKGLPLRAQRWTGPRFSGIGESEPKASDHAPCCIDVNLP